MVMSQKGHSNMRLKIKGRKWGRTGRVVVVASLPPDHLLPLSAGDPAAKIQHPFRTGHGKGRLRKKI